MFKYTAIKVLPLGILLLSGCAAAVPGDNVTASTPGYIALKNEQYATAQSDFQASNAATPHSAYDELDLGATYQREGRMDLATPLYRAAITDGNDSIVTVATTQRAEGHTVGEIACQNLAMGLKPATVAGTASPCQTTLVVTTSDATSVPRTSYNTYFAFDKSDLTAKGQANVDSAAKQARDNPGYKVTLVGKASLVGTDGYNMALSKRRADTVRAALMADGVPSSQIAISWVGDRELPVGETAGTEQPLNRVVEGSVQ